MEASLPEPSPDPIGELEDWIEEARAKGLPQPASVTFVTASADGRPSARTVTLKRLERGSLIFTSALWTRKAQEIVANPYVALLFFWPELGRQAHVAGAATLAERELAEELFAERDPLHQLQTIVSRQGEPIDAAELAELRTRLAHLAEAPEAPPKCPDDWGAFRVTPEVIELGAKRRIDCMSDGCFSALAMIGAFSSSLRNPLQPWPPPRLRRTVPPSDSGEGVLFLLMLWLLGLVWL